MLKKLMLPITIKHLNTKVLPAFIEIKKKSTGGCLSKTAAGIEGRRLKAISHEQKFANPTLNSTVRSTQTLRIEFNLPSDVEVGLEENTLNLVDFSLQS
ncbi:hypothetical protein AVEN_211870-1 [Araneus ventricosus]|uniref:Uncharacterized protein n=1 Tax=Araneus ventricosus TaxID=182803 RepID=A0A4Y2SJ17_ARAVE|nr:hypothetical protein AVEN_211870-1 [Araneus ventricosus]